MTNTNELLNQALESIDSERKELLRFAEVEGHHNTQVMLTVTERLWELEQQYNDFLRATGRKKSTSSMRTLGEIMDDFRNGKMPTHEECFMALHVYRLMFNMNHRTLRDLLISDKKPPEFIRKQKAKLSFEMYRGALSKSPGEWLGVDG